MMGIPLLLPLLHWIEWILTRGYAWLRYLHHVAQCIWFSRQVDLYCRQFKLSRRLCRTLLFKRNETSALPFVIKPSDMWIHVHVFFGSHKSFVPFSFGPFPIDTFSAETMWKPMALEWFYLRHMQESDHDRVTKVRVHICTSTVVQSKTFCSFHVDQMTAWLATAAAATATATATSTTRSVPLLLSKTGTIRFRWCRYWKRKEKAIFQKRRVPHYLLSVCQQRDWILRLFEEFNTCHFLSTQSISHYIDIPCNK